MDLHTRLAHESLSKCFSLLTILFLDLSLDAFLLTCSEIFHGPVRFNFFILSCLLSSSTLFLLLPTDIKFSEKFSTTTHKRTSNCKAFSFLVSSLDKVCKLICGTRDLLRVEMNERNRKCGCETRES